MAQYNLGCARAPEVAGLTYATEFDISAGAVVAPMPICNEAINYETDFCPEPMVVAPIGAPSPTLEVRSEPMLPRREP